jgi:hypothetical protein
MSIVKKKLVIINRLNGYIYIYIWQPAFPARTNAITCSVYQNHHKFPYKLLDAMLNRYGNPPYAKHARSPVREESEPH